MPPHPASSGPARGLESAVPRRLLRCLLPFLAAIALAGCGAGKEEPRDGRLPDAALARGFQEALQESDPGVRRERLLDLEGRLQPRVESDRWSRLLMVRTAEALAPACDSLGLKEEARRWKERSWSLCWEYLARDPADGRLRGLLVSRYTAGQREAEAWKALEGAADVVDLDTADPLISAAASLEALRHVRPDPGRETSRRLLTFYETLLARTQADGGHHELHERLLCEQGLIFLGLGRVDEARGRLSDLEQLGPPGPQYFRLETALQGLPGSKR